MKHIRRNITLSVLGTMLFVFAVLLATVNIFIPEYLTTEARRAILLEDERKEMIPLSDTSNSEGEEHFLTPSVRYLEVDGGLAEPEHLSKAEYQLREYCKKEKPAADEFHTLKTGGSRFVFRLRQVEANEYENAYTYVLYVDIGAKDKDEALAKAPEGTPITFATPSTPIGDGCLLCKAGDDRVGCYNLLRLLHADVTCDTWFAFTCQEEVGSRGAYGAAFRIQPDVALILEGTTANDAGEQDETRKVCRLGKGVAVSFMDKASIAQPELFAELLLLAEGSGIAHQVKMAVAGGNDSGPIQRTGCGAKVCVLSVPCRYIHSPSTVLCLEDVEAQYLLAKAYLTR